MMRLKQILETALQRIRELAVKVLCYGACFCVWGFWAIFIWVIVGTPFPRHIDLLGARLGFYNQPEFHVLSLDPDNDRYAERRMYSRSQYAFKIPFSLSRQSKDASGWIWNSRSTVDLVKGLAIYVCDINMDPPLIRFITAGTQPLDTLITKYLNYDLRAFKDEEITLMLEESDSSWGGTHGASLELTKLFPQIANKSRVLKIGADGKREEMSEQALSDLLKELLDDVIYNEGSLYTRPAQRKCTDLILEDTGRRKDQLLASPPWF